MNIAGVETVLDNLRSGYESLSAAEKKIADFILKNPNKAVNCNVSELANASGTSDATIVRFCKHVGYSGYYQLRITLSRELGRSDYRDAQEIGEDTIAGMLQKCAANIQSISRKVNEQTFRDCARLIENCNYVHIVAAGNTTPVAHHVGFRLGRLGVRTTHHMLMEYYMNDIVLAQENDVVLAISQSGTSKQVVKALEIAVERKIPTIAVVGYEYSPVARLSDYLLPAVIPEQSFDYRKSHVHIYEMAVLDALIEMISNDLKKQGKDFDLQEMLVSDSKL